MTVEIDHLNFSINSPAPWKYNLDDRWSADMNKAASLLDADGGLIARFKTEGKTEADVRLASFAPEMANLLLLALPYIEESEAFNKPDAPKLSDEIKRVLFECDLFIP